MLVHCFDHLISLEEIQDLIIGVKLVDRGILFLVFDILTAQAVDRVHPGRLAVKVRDDGTAARLEDPSRLGNGPARIAGGMQHAVGPDRVEGIGFKRQIKSIRSAHIFRLYAFYFEMFDRHCHGIGSEVGSCDANAALQEFQAVIAHPAADLEQVFALQQLRLTVDALHDPGELIRVHPRPDVSKELRGSGLDALIGHVLKTQGMGVPIIVDLTNGCRQFFIHVRFFPILIDFSHRPVSSECRSVSPPAAGSSACVWLWQCCRHCVLRKNPCSCARTEAAFPKA